MRDWFASNWWWLLPIVGGIALVTFKVHRRGGDEPLVQRIFYAMFPILDAKSEVRRQLTPRIIILWSIGMVIAIAYAIYDGAFGP